MKKQISTEQNEANISEVMQLLAEMPTRLESLCQKLSKEQLRTPLAHGERTPTEVLAHILNCEAITSQSIHLALLTNEPLLPDLHAERDLGKLLRLDLQPFDELLAYFKLRRAVLLRILGTLNEKQWSRTMRESKKQRKESIYWRARGQALHELEHIFDFESKLR
jgi:hypothetical protein